MAMFASYVGMTEIRPGTELLALPGPLDLRGSALRRIHRAGPDRPLSANRINAIVVTVGS